MPKSSSPIHVNFKDILRGDLNQPDHWLRNVGWPSLLAALLFAPRGSRPFGRTEFKEVPHAHRH